MLKHFRQLATESIIYGLSSTVSKMLYIILVPVYTRVFTPEEYGVVSLVVIAVAVASVIAVMALDNSAHRWFWDSDDTDARKSTIASWAWCQLAVSTVLAVVFVAAAPAISRLLIGSEQAAAYVRVAAVALPLTTLTVVTTNWLRMQRRAWSTLLFNAGNVALSLLFTVWFVVILRWGIAGVFWAQVAAAACYTVVGVLVLRDWIDPRRFQLGRLREMLRFALPLIPAGIAFWVVSAVDRFFVQRYVSTADVGVYQVGFAVASVVAVATQAFQQAWGPFALSIHRRAEAREFYARALLVYVWLACLASTAVSILAPEILSVFVTTAYADAVRVAALLSFGFVIMGLGYIAALGPGLAKVSGPTGLAVTGAAVLNIALNLAFVPRLGKEGAALATLLSQAVVPLYLFRRSQQLYPIPYRFAPAFGIFALAVVLTLAGMSLDVSRVGLSLALKALLLGMFVPALFAFRIVRVEALSALRRRLEARVSY